MAWYPLFGPFLRRWRGAFPCQPQPVKGGFNLEGAETRSLDSAIEMATMVAAPWRRSICTRSEPVADITPSRAIDCSGEGGPQIRAHQRWRHQREGAQGGGGGHRLATVGMSGSAGVEHAELQGKEGGQWDTKTNDECPDPGPAWTDPGFIRGQPRTDFFAYGCGISPRSLSGYIRSTLTALQQSRA
jgi:hypothetical protein